MVIKDNNNNEPIASKPIYLLMVRLIRIRWGLRTVIYTITFNAMKMANKNCNNNNNNNRWQ